MNQSNKIFDALLVLECQAGSKKAMNLLVKRWHAKLCKQAYWYTHDKEEAKDIAQDSWRVILNKIQFLKDPNSFGSWALKIVTRKALDWLRKQKRKPNKMETHYDLPDTTAHSHHPMASEAFMIVLHNEVRRLPAKQKAVLNLFYLEELSIQQIGVILEISTGTVKSRLFTARETLKTILKNRNHEK